MGARTSDVTEFAFTDAGPWVVDPDALAWSEGIGSVRAAVAEEAAALLRRRRRPPVGRILRVLAALARALVVWRGRRR